MTTERWTDEMLDELASSVSELRVSTIALFQLAQQSQRNWEESQQRHAESDERFEVLLAEVRHLIRRLDQR